MKKRNNILFVVLFFVIFTVVMILRARAESFTDVSTESDLITAIANNENIAIINDISLTNEINISSSYNGIIKASSSDANIKIMSANPNLEFMFNVEGKVNFKNLSIDGNRQEESTTGKATGGSRAFRVFGESAKLALENVIVENCVSTVDGVASRFNSNGGAILILGNAELNIASSIFRNNKSVDDLASGRAGQGGAIYANDNVRIDISDSTFENNSSGTGNIGAGGGAIYVDTNTTLNITNTTFDLNHCGNVNNSFGNQGGAIQVSKGSVLNSTNNTYIINRNFNTGGAVYLHRAVANINNDTYRASNQGDAYGISGGAICSEDSDLNINNSNFNISNSKVIHVGGIIDIVGTGNFNLRNSTLVGSGSWWNGPSIATFGGAVGFESGSSATAIIENTTIRDVVTDENGGAISTSTRKNEISSVNLTLRNTDIVNTRTRYAWKDTVGGAIYVAKGSTVSIEAGSIRDTFAVRGGGIYNDGAVDISNGTTLDNNTTYQIGGGIYNDGSLTIDEAVFNNNRNAEGRNYPGKTERIGDNIYAKKDVTITPNARFINGDIRVLDGSSSVILTGALNSKIDISISEAPIGSADSTYYEAPKRYLGYTVAKSNGKYTISADDANYLNYVSLNTDQAIAPYEDISSVGKWDFVLAKPNNKIVLGQRAKVIYHANLDGAGFNINGVSESELNKLYTVYTSDTPFIYPVAINTLKDDENPTASGYELVSWYNHNRNGSIDTNPVSLAEVRDYPNENRFDFGNIDFRSGANPITNIIDRNIFHVYAGWRERAVEPENPEVPVNPPKTVNPEEPVEPEKPVNPPKPIESGETTKATEATRERETTKATETTRERETTKATEATRETETTKATETTRERETTKATETTRERETTKATETTRETESIRSTDSFQPHEETTEATNPTTVAPSTVVTQENKDNNKEIISNPHGGSGNKTPGRVVVNNINKIDIKNSETTMETANASIVDETADKKQEVNIVMIDETINKEQKNAIYLSNVPKTKDTSNRNFWLLCVMLSFISLIALGSYKMYYIDNKVNNKR